MRNNKGQAAMEFLMTYGWAILIVVIAVAALAAFGIFDPARLAQERCVGESTKFACASSQAALNTTSGNVSVQLTNGAGNPVIITGFGVSDDGDCTLGNWDAGNGTNTPARHNPGENFIVTVDCGFTTEDDVFQETFDVNYNVVDGLPGLSGDVEVVIKT